MEEYNPMMSVYHNSLKKADAALAKGDSLKAARFYLNAIEHGEKEISRTKAPRELKRFQEGINFCYDQLDALLPEEKKVLLPVSANPGIKTRQPVEHANNEFLPVEKKYTFDEVAGMGTVKELIDDLIIGPLVSPEIYQDLVGELSGTGIILYGPPGCGKTYIANSAAGEASKQTGQDIKFFEVKHSQLLSKWHGQTQKNIDNYFMTLADNAPCIGFIDEFDTIAKSRGSGSSELGNKTVNAILSAFGYLEGKNVIVLAATNRPWELDSAVTRTGRFGNKIFVPPPDFDSRKGTFELELNGKKIESIAFEDLAALTEGYANSDISEICTKAGLLKAKKLRRNQAGIARELTMDDLAEIILSETSSLSVWADERRKEMIDWRYSDGRIKGKFEGEYSGLLDCANDLKRTLDSRIDEEEDED